MQVFLWKKASAFQWKQEADCILSYRKTVWTRRGNVTFFFLDDLSVVVSLPSVLNHSNHNQFVSHWMSFWTTSPFSKASFSVALITLRVCERPKHKEISWPSALGVEMASVSPIYSGWSTNTRTFLPGGLHLEPGGKHKSCHLYTGVGRWSVTW